MKTILLLAATLLSEMAFATIFTVSNNPAVPAQYTDLGPAQTVAESGDTLQIVGSVTLYYYFSATKQLHIVGPGWGGPDLAATLYGLTFSAGSAGSVAPIVPIVCPFVTRAPFETAMRAREPYTE